MSDNITWVVFNEFLIHHNTGLLGAIESEYGWIIITGFLILLSIKERK